MAYRLMKQSCSQKNVIYLRSTSIHEKNHIKVIPHPKPGSNNNCTFIAI